MVALRAQTPEVETPREAIRKADVELARAVADRQLDRLLDLVSSGGTFRAAARPWRKTGDLS